MIKGKLREGSRNKGGGKMKIICLKMRKGRGEGKKEVSK